MRAHAVIASVFFATVLLGCSSPPSTAPFTLPTLPVVGLSSATDVEFVGIDERTSALLATGLYRASTSRFVTEFLSVAAVPAVALRPFTLDDEDCTATITPTNLQTVALRWFVRDGGGGLLLLTNLDGFEDVPTGGRVYEFWLTPTAGSVFGTCVIDRDPGYTITYQLELAAGWSVVANVVTAVASDGTPTALRYRTEAPVAGTAWRYVEVGGAAAGAWPTLGRGSHFGR
jgi:hypothetical protein